LVVKDVNTLPQKAGLFIMRSIHYVCLVVTISIIGLFPVHPCIAGQRTLRVGIIGDQTGTDDIDRSYSALEEGAGILTEKSVDFVFHIGDIVESKAPEHIISENFKTATGLLDKIGRPWYLTPGDHDVNPTEYRPASEDRSKETLFRDLYAARNRKVKQNFYYSFDHDGYHFIALYSQETLHVDPRWGNIFMSRISDDQFTWLEMDLEAHKDSKGMVVFLHQPLWYNWTGWLRIHQLLRRYPVLAVVAGHFHHDQSDGRIDDIHYVIVGATGGSVKQANRDGGNVWHVTVMTIRATGVEFELFALDDHKPLVLTPRVDMDRVQALDTMLGGLVFFPQKTIYLEESTLVSSCGSREPATLHLTNLGNPIDVPVELHLRFRAAKIKLASPTFAGHFCRPRYTPLNCTIPPGMGIAISNLSRVVSTFECKDSDAVWTALPVLSANSAPQAGAIMDLEVRVAFREQSGSFFVEKYISASLRECTQ
jgi:3',5'-cyclic AMP phosphodiesterase CpdA